MVLSTKKIPLIFLFALLSNCNTDFDIRECIGNLTDNSNIVKICKTLDNKSCYNSYFSMALCLANN